MRTFFLVAGVLASATFSFACEPANSESSSFLSDASVPATSSVASVVSSDSISFAVFDELRSSRKETAPFSRVSSTTVNNADYMDAAQNRRIIDQNEKIIAQNEKIIDLLEKIIDNNDDSSDKLISQNDRIITLLDRIASKR